MKHSRSINQPTVSLEEKRHIRAILTPSVPVSLPPHLAIMVWSRVTTALRSSSLRGIAQNCRYNPHPSLAWYGPELPNPLVPPSSMVWSRLACGWRFFYVHTRLRLLIFTAKPRWGVDCPSWMGTAGRGCEWGERNLNGYMPFPRIYTCKPKLLLTS